MRFRIQNAGRSFPDLNLLIEQAPRSERLLPRAAARWLPMVVARIRTNPLALTALLLMASAAALCFAQSPGNGGSLTGKPGLSGQQAPVVSLAPNESPAPIYPRATGQPVFVAPASTLPRIAPLNSNADASRLAPTAGGGAVSAAGLGAVLVRLETNAALATLQDTHLSLSAQLATVHHSTARGSHTMRCARRAAMQQSTSIEASAISNVPGRIQTAWASAIPQAKSHAA
jgi:hypothetical protein